MTPQEILNIIEAFFEAILRVLKSLGLVKEEEATEEETTEALSFGLTLKIRFKVCP